MNHVVMILTNSDATMDVVCSCGARLACDLDNIYFDELSIIVIGHRGEQVK